MEDHMQTPNPITLELDGNAVIIGNSVKLTAKLSPPLTPDEFEEKKLSIEFTVGGEDATVNKDDPRIATWKPRAAANTRRVAIARLFDEDGAELGYSQRHIYVLSVSMSKFTIDGPDEPVVEGASVTLTAVFAGTATGLATDTAEKYLRALRARVDWDAKGFGAFAAPPPRVIAKWNSRGVKADTYEITARLVNDEDGVLTTSQGSAIQAPPAPVQVKSSPLARGDVVPVSLQRSTAPHTGDQILWTGIRETTLQLQFAGSGFQTFIDNVLGLQNIPPQLPGGALLKSQIAAVPTINKAPYVYGVGAYEMLKTATQVFLLLEAGVADTNDPKVFRHELPFDEREESGRRGELMTQEDVKRQLATYLGQDNRLPYLDRVIRVAFPDEDKRPYAAMHSYGLLESRALYPSMIELIWSYWHEEGMLVQTMAAISRRFQNVRGPGDRDPLAHLEIDPLRPLNNLLWGYVQDEWNRLTLQRRAYEYDHQYGLTIYGKAVPQMRTADSRSKFLEAFHHLLHLCSVFYKEDNDTTVVADGFPLLNALKEVHMVLAHGAHNQFGDLQWTARAEMLMQQWLLARPEMRDFLQSRPMVPYKEPWMPQVDTMKTLQGWSDVSVTHFRDLAVYGEQILLSVRYGDWIGINDENSAKNWARYWRPEVQGYLHAYRAVSGVDLTNPDTVDTTMPAIHLRKRLATQRVR
jgi:hypothetical protein